MAPNYSLGDGVQLETLTREELEQRLRRDWSQRETRRIVDSDLRDVGQRTELTNKEFRRLARFIFAEHPKLRRKALVTGKIEMGDGRTVRRRRARRKP